MRLIFEPNPCSSLPGYFGRRTVENIPDAAMSNVYFFISAPAEPTKVLLGAVAGPVNPADGMVMAFRDFRDTAE